MKKVILSLSLSFALLAGSAQTQPAQPQKPIILQVTPEAYQLIINALAELPAKTSYMLITGLNQQYAQQMQGANVPVGGSDSTAAQKAASKKAAADKIKADKKVTTDKKD